MPHSSFTIEMIISMTNNKANKRLFITSNHGAQFISKNYKQFLSDNNILGKMASILHPQTDRLAERLIRNLNTKMRSLSLVNNKSWKKLLPAATKFLNLQLNAKTNLFPFKVLFNIFNKTEFPPEMDLNKKHENVCKDVYSSLEKTREAMIKNKTEPTEAKTYLFSVGDNVLLSSKVVRTNRPKKNLTKNVHITENK
jgi:hypothetical protein